MQVDGHSERWLRRGFPWVYPKELTGRGKGIKAGTVVQIQSAQGTCLGTGLFDQGWIAVRRFRPDHGKLDTAFFRRRLRQAKALRDALIEPNTTAFRLVNGENDGLPGIRIDVYGAHYRLSFDCPCLLSILDALCDAIETDFETRAIYLAWRPDSRDAFQEKSAPRPPGLIRGHGHKGPLRVSERGIDCLVDLHGKVSVGLFSDMRDNRAWLESAWGGQRVLNLFAHTGFFSVVAAMHGASEVISVDLSEAYLDRAEANFMANQIDPASHEFLKEDVRKILDRYRRQGEKFDRIVLDPPSFSHGPEGVMSLKRDYPGLVSSSLKVLSPSGWFIGALNLGEVSPKDFHGWVRDGAQKAGVELQLVFEGGQSGDFPANTSFPEGRYLKFGVWRRVD